MDILRDMIVPVGRECLSIGRIGFKYLNHEKRVLSVSSAKNIALEPWNIYCCKMRTMLTLRNTKSEKLIKANNPKEPQEQQQQHQQQQQQLQQQLSMTSKSAEAAARL